MSNCKQIEIFISTNGSDNALGTIEKPFLTLEKAKKEIVELKNKNNDLEKITVYLREGKYNLENTFEIGENEGGNEKLSIVYTSYNNENVTISGGLKIDFNQFALVQEQDELDKLKECAKGKVYYADFKGTKISQLLTTPLDWRPQDMKDPNCPFATDISCINAKINYPSICANGYLLQQSRFPNKGYANMNDIADEGVRTRSLKPGDVLKPHSFEDPQGGKFNLFESFNVEQWQKEFARTKEIYVDGHFSNDWYTDENYIGSIDNNGYITLLKPARYGVNLNDDVYRRIAFKNILCELDQEGEWYFDKELERLYIMPIKLEDGQVADYEVTGDATTLIHLNNATNVSFERMSIECAREVGVAINGGKNNKVAGCTIKNMTQYAATVDGGFDNGILSCDIFDCNQAVRITGGEIKTLTHCNNYAINNNIFHCKLRGYGVINCTGCGIKVTNNLFHDMSCSLSLKTAEAMVELNEFYNVGQEMGDFNCGYIGVEFYTVGNYFKNNFIHHMMRYNGIKHLGGLRNDDGGLGTSFIGNVFYKSGSYATSGHGPMTTIKNNIVLDTPAVWYTVAKGENVIKARWELCEKYRRGELFAGDKEDLFFRAEQVIGEKGWEKEPFISKYPMLKQTLETNPWCQTNSVVTTNYTNGDVDTAVEMHGRGGFSVLPDSLVYEEPCEITMDAFTCPENLNFKLKDDFKTMDGFEEIPFEKIGLFVDEYRKEMPNKDDYRHAVYLEHENEESSEKIEYDITTANDIYPDPAYLK